MANHKTSVSFVKTLWGVTPLMGNTPEDGKKGDHALHVV